jgi:Carboxypeptidase regulatory-like domain/TonB dependent receptor
MRTRVWLVALIVAAFAASSSTLPANAGTTGGVAGRIVDSTTAAPIADVSVSVISPSQAATVRTDASGNYRFLSLPPDTYTISFNKDGYTPVSNPGITIIADHVQTVNVAMRPLLKTIAQVRTRAATDIVRPGITSDVYSVDAAGQRAAQNLTGVGALNNAYGAIASVPGVALDPGEQGWFQTLHIRGGDFDQVGWELDGIPVNRVYDNAPQTMLSSLGQQELQVYTGGTPATADAQGLSGYVNQVIKTGTYPGFGALSAGVGSPTFYHQFSAEAGGSNPDRTFSYYVGLAGAGQGYRYVDPFNGGGTANSNSFFYPVNALQGINGFVYTGCTSFPCDTSFIDPSQLFATGSAYGIGNTAQRDNVVNVHFALPHKNSTLRDDIQMLWMTSEVNVQYYSSGNDLNPAIAGCACTFGPLFWDDAYLYKGSMLQPADPASLSQYFFPSSPPHEFNNTLLPLTVRDTNDNGVAITKLQYQHSFSENAFLRLYGYTLYSNWFIWGPNSAAQPFYGAELADYEIPNHTWGANLSFTDQLSAKHLLVASAVYTSTNLQRYYSPFFTSSRAVSLLMDGNRNCIDPVAGTQVGCYFALTNGAFDPSSNSGFYGSAGCIAGGGCAGAGPFPGTTWTAVDIGLTGALNQVHPRFSGASITDQWRPSDRWNINGGLRLEEFRYFMGPTQDQVRDQFWFPKYNAEYCFGQGVSAPVLRTGSGLGPCPNGTVPLPQAQFGALTDVSTSDFYTLRWQPRLGFTYTINPETVLRGSFGVYARPQNSSWVQYNTPQENLASYLGTHFYAYGFNTPVHNIRPDTSYNYDLSIEQRLHGTDWSYKLTPFYRSTQDQLQNFFIDPTTGLESGLNVGHQVSFGVEFAVRKGDFNNQGWSGQLSYTYTHSSIKYQNFPNSDRNVIDNLNSNIQDYNQYTQACAANPSNNPHSQCFYPGFQPGVSPALLASGAAPSQCYTTGGVPAPCGPGNVTNPYWNAAPQPLMDRAAPYPTYDVIPGPVSGENGYWTPDVASLIVNYRHGRLAITPSLNYNSGAEYGSPLSWPGYRPETCSATFTPAGGVEQADPASCSDAGLLPVFTPNPFNGNRFDSLGTYKEPWRLSLNLNIAYDISPKITADVLLTNLVDHCGQRGYAWDQSNVCVYSNLPSGVLYPAGNFYPNSALAAPPPQLRFPYSFWLNNNNTGFVGVKIPFQATFNLHFRL